MRPLLIALLLMNSINCLADETKPIKEANFPTQLQDGSQTLQRKGQIVLTYLWADIYAATLFTPANLSPQRAYEQLRDVRLELFYLRDLDHSDITTASAAILKRQHSPATLSALDPGLKKLQGSFANIQRGDRYALDYDPVRGLNLERNGQVIFNTKDRALAKAYLGIWLAPEGLPETLRQTLLAQTP
ncbi:MULTISPECIES: chalcone isomerase family protein [unclassified Pseudomonas]|uniref:chalcone isomerase family protein n=1 Tax=unclassified Pseudomonas TaxID=196821 RepID=UPI00147571D4|nr:MULTISPECIES: chalcone isomerase family protein [unclassified Pseudomonas]NMY39078.1 hypothetical protein [Pseudomonas sp. WS 5078]NMY61994.1 hypothetical protein [Pseudomonas sp. WS 5354]